MHRKLLLLALSLVLFFASACKSKTDDKDAIRTGVLKHLAAMQGLNLQNMDVNVLEATVNGNVAQAQVEVHAKGTDPTTGAMQIGYSMEKQGSEWVVVKSTGMMGRLQHPAPGTTLPSGAMPPGHPDFNEILKTAPSGSQQPAAQQPPPRVAKP
jgi:hypothetical protein